MGPCKAQGESREDQASRARQGSRDTSRLAGGSIADSCSRPRKRQHPSAWLHAQAGVSPLLLRRFCSSTEQEEGARGVIVFDGVDGRECDAGLFEGQLKNLPGSGLFLECLEIEPSTGSMPQLPPELEMKNSVTVAPATATEETVKARVAEVLLQASNAHPDDVSVPEVSLLHIPIVTVELQTGNRSYRKILQAATGKMIWDETRKCSLCDSATSAVCEDCGAVVCHDHTRLCSSCRKHLCTGCVTIKGVINKTPLCRSCHG